VKGQGRGKGLGFPTANLAEIDTQIPANGVYAAAARVEGDSGWRQTATHIGPNATFGATDRTVEVHFLDFDANLYGKQIEVDFARQLRESRKFAGIEDLKTQIQLDIQAARITD
jgi:riboflavin kinase/FMN adenylyltransferase